MPKAVNSITLHKNIIAGKEIGIVSALLSCPMT